MTDRKLLAIVTTDKNNRIRCQHKGCNHPVYKAIHVVLDEAKLKVIGSTCFKNSYSELNTTAQFTDQYGDAGRKLTAQEIEKLVQNTELLVAQLTQEYEKKIQEEQLRLARREQFRAEQEHQRAIRLQAIAQQQSIALEQERIRASQLQAQKANTILQARADAERRRISFDEKVVERAAQLMAEGASWKSQNNDGESTDSTPVEPKDWVNSKKSALALLLRDGSAWIRCEDVSGHQRLYPVNPSYDWTNALPTRLGYADVASRSFIVKSIIEALNSLRANGVRFELVCTSYKDALRELKLRI